MRLHVPEELEEHVERQQLQLFEVRWAAHIARRPEAVDVAKATVLLGRLLNRLDGVDLSHLDHALAMVSRA